MKLDFNELNHNYIIRVVIFSIFLYKFKYRDIMDYKQSVHNFIKKRLPWDINLQINTGNQISKEEEREILLNQLLYDEDDDLNDMFTFQISFLTPLKEVTMIINLLDEDRYEIFLFD